jgi:NarL family two-component system response regulator LiaR
VSQQDVIRVMIVDDHLVVRQGFGMFLQAFPDLLLVGDAQDGAEALERCGELKPDVVLMDMMMPGMSGIETIRAMRSQYPEMRFIALTSFNEDQQLVQDALEAGALGFLFKDVSVHSMANAIREVMRGNPVLAPNAMRMLIQSKTQRSPQDFHLSEREQEVLALVVEGLSNQQIAERLSVSHSTVKFRVSSILGKLGAASRTEAVKIAHQHKLVK